MYMCVYIHIHTHTYMHSFSKSVGSYESDWTSVPQNRTRDVGVVVNGNRILGFPLGLYSVCVGGVCVWSILLSCQSIREEIILYISRSSSNAKWRIFINRQHYTNWSAYCLNFPLFLWLSHQEEKESWYLKKVVSGLHRFQFQIIKWNWELLAIGSIP